MAPASERSPRSKTRTTRRESMQATRQALVEAAAAEFAEKGLDAPSLDAICARAGFTRGAFYVHFRHREELVAAAMEHALSLFLDAVIQGGTESGDLDAIVDRFVTMAARGIEDLGGAEVDPLPGLAAGVPFHQLLAACQRNEEVRARFVAIMDEARKRVAGETAAAQASGRVRRDGDALAQAQLLVLLALGVSAAADLRLPVDIGRARDALLKWLAGPPASDASGG